MPSRRGPCPGRTGTSRRTSRWNTRKTRDAAVCRCPAERRCQWISGISRSMYGQPATAGIHCCSLVVRQRFTWTDGSQYRQEVSLTADGPQGRLHISVNGRFWPFSGVLVIRSQCPVLRLVGRRQLAGEWQVYTRYATFSNNIIFFSQDNITSRKQPLNGLSWCKTGPLEYSPKIPGCPVVRPSGRGNHQLSASRSSIHTKNIYIPIRDRGHNYFADILICSRDRISIYRTARFGQKR